MNDNLTTAVAVTKFWALVDTDGGSDECWPWTGYTEDGYGRFHYSGAMCPAHRLALMFWTGERPANGLDTCHSCNNPICCNPHHLRFDTRQSNVADSIAAGTHRVRSKITERDVVIIRQRVAAGAAQNDLADQYGISCSAVSAIVRGDRWPNAGGPTHKNARPGRQRKEANHG